MRRHVLAFGLIAGLFLGCAPQPSVPNAQAAPADSPATTFTFRIQGEPETLDWNRAHTPIETYLLMNLMEGLVTFDENLKVVPSLAKSWIKSQDGKTFTFKLRDGVKWSDGVPLKAQDFVYSWKRLLSPTTAASYAYFLFDVEGAEDFNKGKNKDFANVGIKALDDLTLQVKLVKPVAHWISIPTFWVTFPLRQDVVEKHGEAWPKPGRMVTLGPFMLTSHEIDNKIVLKKNPHYTGSRGNIETVVGLIVKDDSTALTLYESGKFDFLVDISTLDLKRLQGRPDLKAFPYLKTGYLGFSANKYPVNNAKVRRAIGMAIDKTALPKVLHGGQVPATSFIPPKMMSHSADIGLKFDPAKAKAELQAAGINTNRPIQLELICPNWDKQVTLAQYLQGELKKNLGVDVSISPYDHKTFRAQLDLHTAPMFEASWSADYPDPDNFMSLFLGSSGNNRTTWKNAKYDQLVMDARYGQNQKAREKAYAEAQKILQETDAIILPLYYEPQMALVRPRVKGLELNPLNYLILKKVNLGT